MPTIKDVARHAGVSVSTVSYALSGKRRISSETRDRVQQAIHALGYRPHAGAQALASRRSQILALFMPAADYFSVSVGMAFVTAITSAARGRGYDVLLMTADEGDEGLRRVAYSALADGVLPMEVSVDDARVATIRELGIPAALLGQPDDPHGLPWVDLDFTGAGGLCVEHLAGLGHRRIGLLGPNHGALERRLGYAVRTLAGVRAAAERLELSLVTERSPAVRPRLAGAVRRLLAAEPRITALIVHDQEALATVEEVLAMDGVAVPTDLSVLTLTSAATAQRTSPTLTFVELPVAAMAEHAVDLAVGAIAGDAAAHVLLPPVLHERGSTAAPHRHGDSAVLTHVGEEPSERHRPSDVSTPSPHEQGAP
jgi:LacI family transcriptional regulator